MRPIDFSTANQTFSKPKEMTDEECTPLRAEIGVDVQGYQYICTAWMPNIDDLEAIKRGEPVYLKILSPVLFPMHLFTLNEKGEINEL